MANIRVLIAEDEPLAQLYLLEVLEREPDVEVLGAVSDGLEAVSQTLQLQPDVLLLDLYLPEIHGLEVMRRLAEGEAKTHVLVLTVDANEKTAVSVFRAGAKGFLPKTAAKQYLARAIRVVAEGETWIDRRTTSRLIEELEFLSRKAAQAKRQDLALSQREKEVLVGIGRGLTNAQIARELFVSERTVKVHVGHIFQKLDVQNRFQAALLARRLGLVEEEDAGAVVKAAACGPRPCPSLMAVTATATDADEE